MAGALLLFVCAGRIAWMTTTLLLAGSPSVSSAPATAAPPFGGIFSRPPASDHRPDLEALKEGAKTGLIPGKAPLDETSLPRRRRLLVDLGPERSVVYVNGTKVGRVPYGGHVVCQEGEKVKVEVLPPQGLPLTQFLVCLGESIESRK